MVTPVTCVIVHNKPGNITSWGHHGTPGWYIGPSLDHYKCMQCYMPETEILLITDTLQYIPKAFSSPNIITEYYLQQAIGEILAIIQDSPKTLHFLSYGDETKHVFNYIANILQKSTDQPCLKILPLPPMLTQSRTQYPSSVIIPHIAATGPRVEPVVQPPRVQAPTISPISPTRVQHAP